MERCYLNLALDDLKCLIQQFAAGRFSAAEERRLWNHMLTCDRCWGLYLDEIYPDWKE